MTHESGNLESDFDVPPTEEMISMYRSLIGSIGYAATTVRFDVSYGLSVLSRFLAKSNEKLVNAVKRIIKYLVKTKDLGIILALVNHLTLLSTTSKPASIGESGNLVSSRPNLFAIRSMYAVVVAVQEQAVSSHR